jgi:hypothetical protein
MINVSDSGKLKLFFKNYEKDTPTLRRAMLTRGCVYRAVQNFEDQR